MQHGIQALARVAQIRLCGCTRHLKHAGKADCHVSTAVARELAVFLWAIACDVSGNPTPARTWADEETAGKRGRERLVRRQTGTLDRTRAQGMESAGCGGPVRRTLGEVMQNRSGGPSTRVTGERQLRGEVKSGVTQPADGSVIRRRYKPAASHFRQTGERLKTEWTPELDWSIHNSLS